ncbi:MAG: Ig-like domain-containing protein, partial [Bacteroidales bacterium]|nr:Ig-like domain-containing protein [Bacteroidales bacterium]
MYKTKTNIIVAACILILGACKEEAIELTGISVSPKSVSLVFGGTPDSQQITATPVPENATGYTFTWTSDKEEVATVSPQGLVTATGPGTTEVAVKSGNWVR